MSNGYSFPITGNSRATLVQWSSVLRKMFGEGVPAPEAFIPTPLATAGGTISAFTIRNCFKQVENNKVNFSVDFSLTWSVAGPEVKLIFPFNELNNVVTTGHGGVLYSGGGTTPTGLLGYIPKDNNGLFIRRYDNSNFAVAAHDYYMTGFYFFE